MNFVNVKVFPILEKHQNLKYIGELQVFERMAASSRFNPVSVITAPPFLGFQTEEVDIWIIRRNVKVRSGLRFYSVKEVLLQVRRNRRIGKRLCVFISKSVGFFNQNQGSLKPVIYRENHWLTLIADIENIPTFQTGLFLPGRRQYQRFSGNGKSLD